ncbi:hypothetical protein SY88_04435 [Clostridiales bacterium PH28_bin88]|nr:hypothetical protein SY88_04435 [Clostridiales bacterium PH28_bin88]
MEVEVPETAPQQDWLWSIESLRGVAIIAVVVIHVSSIVTSLTPTARSWEMYVAVNRLSSFAVPLFIFLSALTATHIFYRRPGRSWRVFYARRWQQVGVPYLIWSIFYLFYRFGSLGENHTIFYQPFEWSGWTFLGKSYYHMYFFPIVIQLYLLFPLLIAFYRLRSWRFGTFVGLFALAELAFYFLNRAYLYHRFPYSATLLTSYLPLVAAGIWLGAHVGEWSIWWRVWRWPSLVFATVGGGIYWWLYRLVFAGQPVNTLIVQGAWWVYSTGVALLLWGLANSSVIRHLSLKWLARIGSVSFGIYLMHPLFLNEWRRLLPVGTGWSFHLNNLAGFLCIFFASWGMTLFLQRVAVGRYLLGEPRQSQPGPIKLEEKWNVY